MDQAMVDPFPRVSAPLLLQWILAVPFSGAWIVIPVTVIEEARFVILIFCGEPERIQAGHRPGGAEDFSEGTFEASR